MSETNRNVLSTLVFASTQGHSLCRVPSQAELTLCFVLILSDWHGDRPCNKTVVRAGQGKAEALADNERKNILLYPVSSSCLGIEGPDLIAYTEQKTKVQNIKAAFSIEIFEHTRKCTQSS